jgi:hypothetical protein
VKIGKIVLSGFVKKEIGSTLLRNTQKAVRLIEYYSIN